MRGASRRNMLKPDTQGILRPLSLVTGSGDYDPLRGIKVQAVPILHPSPRRWAISSGWRCCALPSIASRRTAGHLTGPIAQVKLHGHYRRRAAEHAHHHGAPTAARLRRSHSPSHCGRYIERIASVRIRPAQTQMKTPGHLGVFIPPRSATLRRVCGDVLDLALHACRSRRSLISTPIRLMRGYRRIKFEESAGCLAAPGGTTYQTDVRLFAFNVRTLTLSPRLRGQNSPCWSWRQHVSHDVAGSTLAGLLTQARPFLRVIVPSISPPAP